MGVDNGARASLELNGLIGHFRGQNMVHNICYGLAVGEESRTSRTISNKVGVMGGLPLRTGMRRKFFRKKVWKSLEFSTPEGCRSLVIEYV